MPKAPRFDFEFQELDESNPRSSVSSNRHIDLQPDDVRRGLGQLVLTVVELVRQLLERQAIRRMESGSLSDEEVERLGLTFSKLSEQIEELKELFDVDDEDLNLDLGPLGRLF